MSFRKKTILFVHCDNCHAEAEGTQPPGWVTWSYPGEEGEVKHNCPACRRHGEERMELGDPPG